MVSLQVLVNDEGIWQPRQMAGSEEEPIPHDVEQLKEWVAYRIIGPTGARSRVIQEEQTEVAAEGPQHKEGTQHKLGVQRKDGPQHKEILVQQVVEVTSMELLTQPSEWAAPCWREACKQAVADGVNLEAVLSGPEAGAEQPLISQEQVDQMVAVAAATRQQRHTATMARLTAKLLNDADNKRLHTALLAEGAAGMWDILSDSQLRSSGLTGAALRGLMAALRKPVLSAQLQLPAACAVWHACVMAAARDQLVQLGVVEALLHIVDSAFSHLQGLSTYSTSGATDQSSSSGCSSSSGSSGTCSRTDYLALLSASLGSLAVLVVDGKARQRLLASRMGLKLLADVAAQPSEVYQQQQHMQDQMVDLKNHPAAEAAAPQIQKQQQQQQQQQQTASLAAVAAAQAEKPAGSAEEGLVAQDAAPASSTDDYCSIAEVPVAIPPTLLQMQPNQVAAEVLAALLLRSPAARTAFLDGGHCRLLLSLLGAADSYVQLCGVAAVSHMAATPSGSPRCDGQLQQDPQLLRDMYSSILGMIQTLVQRQQQQQQQQGGKQQQQQTSEEAVQADELNAMLLEYASLALWVVAAAVAPLMPKEEVLKELAAAGQLALACMQLQGAGNTSPAVLCCWAGVLCTITATKAAAEAAAELPAGGACQHNGVHAETAGLMQALQPALSELLSVEASGAEVTQTKFLAAATVMLLAGFEQHPSEALNSSSNGCQTSEQHPSRTAGPTSSVQQQQQQSINPHPPFRGVFRDALHAYGLLPAILGLTMPYSSQQEEQFGSFGTDIAEGQVEEHGERGSNAAKAHEPKCVAPLFDDGSGIVALCHQVVAAACQMLVAVNQPLPPVSCAQVLGYLWSHIAHQQAAAGVAAAAGTAAAGRRSTFSTNGAHAISKVSLPAAPFFAATIWYLAQHEQHQQQLLLDGRWAEMLELLIHPALHRVKKAAAADSRATSMAGSAGGSSNGGAVAVPRLQLQGLQPAQGHTPGAATAKPGITDSRCAGGMMPGAFFAATSSAAGNCSSSGAATSGGKRVVEATRVVRFCLQSCWLLLQQQGSLRHLAAELPADLQAVYARGRSSWWALELEQPRPIELSSADKLGLSLLFDSLALPDSWDPCLALKSLALNSCWCLASADQAMHNYLVELGVPQCTAAICQATTASGTTCCKDDSTSGASTPGPGTACQLQVAASGYLSAAVQCDGAIQALGGAEAAAQLLTSLLVSCTSCRSPSCVNVALLGRVLSGLAWLSSNKSSAAACCKSKVVSALVEVLRVEGKAYQALQALAKQQYQQHRKQQQQQQQKQQPFGLAGGASNQQKPLLAISSIAEWRQPSSTAVPEAAQPAVHEEEVVEVPALPVAALLAPFSALQQPEAWVQAWLQQHDEAAAAAAVSPCSTSRTGSPLPLSPACTLSGLKHTSSSTGSMGRLASAPGVRSDAASPKTCSSSYDSSNPGGAVSSRSGAGGVSSRSGIGSQAWGGSELAAASQAQSTSSEGGDEDCRREGDGCDKSSFEVSTPDGVEGMLAVWALLNISTHHQGQINICKKGLYTLIRMAQQCAEPQRASVAAAVLENITAARENTAQMYKAELRLKHAALLKQAGVKRVYRERQQQGSPYATADAGAMERGYQGSEQPVTAQGAAAGASKGSAAAPTAALASPPRTTRLQQAAESAILTANMCSSSSRGMPKNITSEEHLAGVLLARVSAMTSRTVVQVHRPDRPDKAESASLNSLMQSARQSAGGGASGAGGFSGAKGIGSAGAGSAEGLGSGSSPGFSDGVSGLVMAVAGIGSSNSKNPTPRANGSDGTTAGAAAGAGAGGAAAGAVGAPGQAPADVRAAFMKWLHEQMPEAVGTAEATAAVSPMVAAAAGVQAASAAGIALQEEVLQGLTEMAELGSTTTEDTEEAEWLEQQREAQKLHTFYKARAAQGDLLRGSLASSLRASTSSLWSHSNTAAASSAGAAAAGRHGRQLERPMSAPGGARSGDSKHKHSSCSPRSPGVAGGVLGSSMMTTARSMTPPASSSRGSSRPCSPILRPRTPAGTVPSAACRCSSPALTGVGAARGSSRGRCASPSSKRGGSGSSTSSSPGKPVDPWSPAVVAYRQIPNASITKPWQVANQLLVAAPEEDVVQELAAAATEVMDGRLPAKSPASVIRDSLQRKATLELHMEQLQLPAAHQQQHGQLQHSAKQQQEDMPPFGVAFASFEGQGCADGCPAGMQDSALICEIQQQQLLRQGQCHSPVSSTPGGPKQCSDAASLCAGAPLQLLGGGGQQHLDESPGGQCMWGQQEEEQQWQQQQCQAASPELLNQVEAYQGLPHVTWREGTGGCNYCDLNKGLAAVLKGNAAAWDLQGSAGAVAGGTADVSEHGHWQGLVVECDGPLFDAQEAASGSNVLDDGEEASLLLERPKTTYARPNHGVLAGKQYIPQLRGMFSAAVADSVRRSRQNITTRTSQAAESPAADSVGGVDVPPSIARPVTVLDASGEVVARPMQMLVKVCDDGTLPERLFTFHRQDPPQDPNLTMHVFEHRDGAKFCSDLFGHYLLPSGKLAHFFLPAAAAKQGHAVTMPDPPATPWGLVDWLPDGLPAAPAAEVLAGYMQPGLAAACLPLLRGLNWVPMPQLAPAPCRCTLAGRRDAGGSLQLQPGPLRFKAVVHVVTEPREFKKPLPPKPARRRRSTGTGAAPQRQQQQQAATATPAAAARPASAAGSRAQQGGAAASKAATSKSGR